MIKGLVTAGCSFSEHLDEFATNRCWPGFLKDIATPTFNMNLGAGSAGNDIISKRAIYGCYRALQQQSRDETVLIVMWSGLARKGFLTDNGTNKLTANVMRNLSNNILFLQGSDYENNQIDEKTPSWIWFNPNFVNPDIVRWYADYDNSLQQLESTLWNMLAVQSFCESKGIKYFWMTMNNDMQENIDRLDKSVHAMHTKHLVNLIDQTNRIHHEGMYEWTRRKLPTAFTEDGFHPDPNAHSQFTHSVIVPYLRSRGIDI